MPLYTWVCKLTGLEVEVIRSFKEYDQPPTVEECPDDEGYTEHDWERLISAMLTVNKWPTSGGSGKGNWGSK